MCSLVLSGIMKLLQSAVDFFLLLPVTLRSHFVLFAWRARIPSTLEAVSKTRRVSNSRERLFLDFQLLRLQLTFGLCILCEAMAHFSILDSEEAKNIAVVHKTNQGIAVAVSSSFHLSL